MFKENDPANFGLLHISMITMFRLSTLDNWSDLLFTNMYGCDHWGYTYGRAFNDTSVYKPRDNNSNCNHPQVNRFLIFKNFRNRENDTSTSMKFDVGVRLGSCSILFFLHRCGGIFVGCVVHWYCNHVRG